MTTDIVERIKRNQAKAATEAAAKYAKLVQSIATGKPPAESTIPDTLDAAGRTLDNLAADVATAQQRASARARLHAAEQAALERPELEARIADAVAVLEAAERAYRESADPLATRLAEIAADERATATVRAELVRTCRDPELLARQADLAARMKRNAEQLRAARRELESASNLRDIHAQRGRDEQSNQAARNAARATADVAALESEAANLRREESELTEAMFEADL